MSMLLKYHDLGPILKKRKNNQVIEASTFSQAESESDIMKGYKLLASAVIEQACEDYKALNKNSGQRAKAENDARRKSDIERNYRSAVRFFKSPMYELYADFLDIGLSGEDVMYILDSQET